MMMKGSAGSSHLIVFALHGTFNLNCCVKLGIWTSFGDLRQVLLKLRRSRRGLGASHHVNQSLTLTKIIFERRKLDI